MAATAMIVMLQLVALTATSSEAGDVAVVSYLPEWRHEGANFETIASSSSHVILFSLEPAPDGGILATDRLPRSEILDEARRAARQHGSRLMVCFGGNGRSAGFARMTGGARSIKRFVLNTVRLLEKHQLDGVDINWEYPGYTFGQGYADETLVSREYDGLLALVRALRAALDPSRYALTLAYYPDGRQEALLARHGVLEWVDLAHAMAYDAPGGAGPSSREFATTVLAQARAAELPARKLTLGLPFYGREASGGGWQTYEDIVQRHWPLHPAADQVQDQAAGLVEFNGVETIAWKVARALEAGWAGVMVWEAGQDCRAQPVVRRGRVAHVRTCPGGESDEASLLATINRTVSGAAARETPGERERSRVRWWPAGQAAATHQHGDEL